MLLFFFRGWRYSDGGLGNLPAWGTRRTVRSRLPKLTVERR